MTRKAKHNTKVGERTPDNDIYYSRLSALEAQRDELLAACKRALPLLTPTVSRQIRFAFDIITEAVAKVEGEPPVRLGHATEEE